MYVDDDKDGQEVKQDQATVMTYLGSLQFFVQEMQRPIAYLSGGQSNWRGGDGRWSPRFSLNDPSNGRFHS